MIKYEKMSLFEAPADSMLVHACNAQGVWGSGIAKEFKSRYPSSYEEYKNYCDIRKNKSIGSGYFSSEDLNEKHQIGWLITSENYGDKKDSIEQIKINTTLALSCFLVNVSFYSNNEVVIYSNKFNSGLFAVPWEDTELILKTVLKHYPNITWIICDPE